MNVAREEHIYANLSIVPRYGASNFVLVIHEITLLLQWSEGAIVRHASALLLINLLILTLMLK